MAEDLDSVYIVGRFGITAEDGGDVGDDPDRIWCDTGVISFDPQEGETKVAGGSPTPWTGGQSTFRPTIDAEGYLTWRGQHFMKLVDLTSEKVNPRVVNGKATHSVRFDKVKAGDQTVTFTTRSIRASADMAVPLDNPATAAAYGLPLGTPVIDLTRALPVPVANSVPIVVGPQGTGIADLVQPTPGTMALELSNGATTTEIELPVGPGGSDAGVASYLDDPESESTRALTAKQVAGLTDPGAARDAADARVVAGIVGKVDAATIKVGTKRATMGTGGCGTTSTFTIPIAGGTIRVPFRFGVKASRFRVKVRSYDTISQAQGPAMTGKAITYGLASTSGNDFETFAFAGSASTSIVATDFAIPGDGSWYASPWVTANTPMPFADGLVAVAFVPASGAAAVVPRGTGRVAWFDSNITTALNTSSSPTAVLGSVPLEYAIEYEFVGDQRVGAFLGDSIVQGVGGKVSDADAGASQPDYKSWPAMAGARSRFVTVNLALSGTEASQWLTPTQDRWSRYDLATTVPDFAYIGLGSNDANSSTPLATFQANLRTVVANMRAKIGNDKPIYLGTITPRNFDAPREALRQSYNAWLRTGPFRVAGVFDFDRVLRDPTTPGTVLPEYFNSDNTHPSRAGYNAMQLSVPWLAGQ